MPITALPDQARRPWPGVLHSKIQATNSGQTCNVQLCDWPICALTEVSSMPGTSIKIHARDGGEFACYLVTPAGDGNAPAIVLASAVHGVDADICALADEFGSHGYIAAAPD